MAASIDRIDSNKHYTIDNIQIVNKHINWLKGEHLNNEQCTVILLELINNLPFVTDIEKFKNMRNKLHVALKKIREYEEKFAAIVELTPE